MHDMQGTVIDGVDPVLPVILLDARGDRIEVLATVDTGSTAPLTLPTVAIRDLQLPWKMTEDIALADGSLVACNVYEAQVDWLDGPRTIFIYETDSNPLLGMTLMNGCRLMIDAIPNGLVTLTALER